MSRLTPPRFEPRSPRVLLAGREQGDEPLSLDGRILAAVPMTEHEDGQLTFRGWNRPRGRSGTASATMEHVPSVSDVPERLSGAALSVVDFARA
jgi:hypothetical protein